MKPSIIVSVDYNALCIRIDGLLHVNVDRSRLLGVYSWVDQPHARFIVEYVMAGNTVRTEYDSKAKWEAVLQGLDRVL